MNALPYSSATERNRQPILDQLKVCLPALGTVLEIGSGTGQHAVHFSRHLPGVVWQPTDRHQALAGLEARLAAEGSERILKPMQLDVLQDPWPERAYTAVFSANTAHIMSWEAVQAMFSGVADCLVSGGLFCLYGPFNINNNFTSPGNARFDASLRGQDPSMGLRDMADIDALAGRNRMSRTKKLAMPANNFMLVFTKNHD